MMEQENKDLGQSAIEIDINSPFNISIINKEDIVYRCLTTLREIILHKKEASIDQEKGAISSNEISSQIQRFLDLLEDRETKMDVFKRTVGVQNKKSVKVQSLSHQASLLSNDYNISRLNLDQLIKIESLYNSIIKEFHSLKK